MRAFRLCVIIVILAVVSSLLCVAQTYLGSILGLVTDSSGAVVADAKVTVRNVATGIVRNLVTNKIGEYIARDLDPGNYSVTVQAPGFKTAEAKSVVLEVSREVRVNLSLQPGAVAETVEVMAQETMTDTVDSTLNGVLENKAVNELPMQGRDFQNLLPLHPGVQRNGQRLLLRRVDGERGRDSGHASELHAAGCG